jgi:lincosamide and streptogramin A transport system ATP-binding/permease protein
VSHDRALLDAVCDHMMHIGRLGVEVTSGNFSQWHQNREARDRREEAENVKLTKEIKRHRQAAMRTADWADKVESTKTGAGPVDRGYIGHKSAKMMKRAKSAEARRQKAALAKESLLKDIDRAGGLKLVPLDHHSARLTTLEDVSVAYGEKPVFEDFSMVVTKGERIAISGLNGSGKSSVLKLISGIDVPHTGLVRLASGATCSYVPQDTSFLAGGLPLYAEQTQTDLTLFMTILRNLGFERSDLDADMGELSEGQKKKILLARSIATPAHLYIWDEPLNFIDVISRTQIEELILKDRPSMVFVEHDRVFADRVATRNIEIRA